MRHSPALLSLLLLAAPALADQRFPALGRPATPSDIAPLDIDIRPDGAGLPPGQGTVAQGRDLYAAQCTACHGALGAAPIPGVPRLAGGRGTLASAAPVQTVGSFWPYATTLFDYVRRAMPLQAPQSLSPDQVYALSAYILFLNDLVPETAVIDATILPAVAMPNRAGFRTVFHPAEK